MRYTLYSTAEKGVRRIYKRHQTETLRLEGTAYSKAWEQF